jgi:lipooligosaccharide transport system permease protein
MSTTAPTGDISPEAPRPRPRRPRGELPVLGLAVPGWLTYRVWQRNRDVFFQLWRAELLPPLLEPIVTLLGLGLGLGAYVQLGGDLEYVQFLGPGVLVAFPMFVATFEALFGAYFRMTQHGTYDAMVATPVRPEEIVAGEIAWAATRMTINTALIILVLVVFTPWWGLVGSPLILLTLPIAFLTGVVIGALGIAFTSRARSVSQLSYFFSLFILPMFWFSGGFFPLDEFPAWAQTVAWFFPLTHAVELSRALVTGDVYIGLLGNVLWLAVAAIPTFWLGMFAMKKRIVG